MDRNLYYAQKTIRACNRQKMEEDIGLAITQVWGELYNFSPDDAPKAKHIIMLELKRILWEMRYMRLRKKQEEEWKYWVEYLQQYEDSLPIQPIIAPEPPPVKLQASGMGLEEFVNQLENINHD